MFSVDSKRRTKRAKSASAAISMLLSAALAISMTPSAAYGSDLGIIEGEPFQPLTEEQFDKLSSGEDCSIDEMLGDDGIVRVDGSSNSIALLSDDGSTIDGATYQLSVPQELTPEEMDALTTGAEQGLSPLAEPLHAASISARWLDESDWTGIADLLLGPDDLRKACTDNKQQSVRFAIDLALPDDRNFDVGEVSFTIPKHIIAARGEEEASIGDMMLSVPMAPDTKRVFAYTDLGDSYKITNVRRVAAGSTPDFQFTIHNITPALVNGNPDSYDMASMPKMIAELDIAGSESTVTSNALTVRFDTSVRATGLIASAPTVATKLPSALDFDPPEGKSADDYTILSYYSYATASGNQAFAASFTHRLMDPPEGSIILGVVAAGALYEPSVGDPHAVSYESASLEKPAIPGDAGSSFGYATLYVAVPKDAAQAADKAPEAAVTMTFTSADDRETKVLSKIFPESQETNADEDKKIYDLTPYYGLTMSASGSHGYALNKLSTDRSELLRYYMKATVLSGSLTWSDADEDGEVTASELGKAQYAMSIGNISPTLSASGFGAASPDIRIRELTFSGRDALDYRYAKAKANGYKVSDKGSMSSMAIEAGECGYLSGSAPIELSVFAKVRAIGADQGEWQRVSDMEWTGTYPTFDNLALGAKGANGVLTMPEGTYDFRVVATTRAAGCIFSVSPLIELLGSSEDNKALAQALLDASDTPSAYMQARGSLDVTASDVSVAQRSNSAISTLSAAASYSGARTMLSYDQETSQDASNARMTVSASSQAYDHTNLRDIADYREAVGDGVISQLGEGTFYQLLPVGAEVNLDTIGLRERDQVLSRQVIPDWRGTGRPMLVVRAKLAPQPTLGSAIGGVMGQCDAPSLRFQFFINYQELSNYEASASGAYDLDTYFAFESPNATFGSVSGYKGEPDDPTAGNNAASRKAIPEDAAWMMASLTDGERAQDQCFAYASAHVTAVADMMSVSTFDVEASSRDRKWGPGTREAEAINVSDWQPYSYRINVANDSGTKRWNILLFDEIESFDPSASADGKADAGDLTWKGTFAGVDVSRLSLLGCDPKVYYATSSASIPSEGEMSEETLRSLDLDSSSDWHPLTDATDKAQVRAIAIDARRALDGSDFTLDCDKSLLAYVNMLAPSIDQVKEQTGYDGDAEDLYDARRYGSQSEAGALGGAHAYNEAVMAATLQASGSAPSSSCEAQGYTKVGISPFTVQVRATFDDDSDTDRIRPDTLVAKVDGLAPDGSVASTHYVTLDQTGGWAGEFKARRFQEDASELLFTLTEGYLADPEDESSFVEYEGGCAPGYDLLVSQSASAGNLVLTAKNTHSPEAIDVEIHKDWCLGEGQGSMPAIPPVVTADIIDKATGSVAKAVSLTKAAAWDAKASVPRNSRGHGRDYDIKESYVPGFSTDADVDVIDDGTSKSIVVHLTNTYSPQGDVSIAVRNAGAASEAALKKASFGVTPIIKDAEGSPAPGVFDCRVGDETRTFSNGETIEMDGFGDIVIEGVPSEFTVEASEAPSAGWSLDERASKAQAAVIAGSGASLTLANTYSCTTEFKVSAIKELTGRALQARQFTFGFSSVSDNGYVSSIMGTNAQDGALALPIQVFTEKDDGQASVRYVTERDGQQRGYSYDKSVWAAVMVPSDNGDGTMSVDAGYYRVSRIGADPIAEGSPACDEIKFENSYESKASATIRAWVSLSGGQLEGGDYSFALYKAGDDGTAIASATNEADGSITIELPFTQADDGTSADFVLRQDNLGKPGITYSDAEFTFHTVVSDRGDGMLSVATSVDGTPVFENAMAPGKLLVSKSVVGGSKSAEHSFKVRFEGIGLGSDIWEFSRGEVGKDHVDESIIDEENPLEGPEGDEAAAEAEEAPQWATFGTCEWIIEDGTLSIRPANGVSGAIPSNEQKADKQRQFWPWDQSRSEIEKVAITGAVSFNGSAKSMFEGCSNVSSVDMTGADLATIKDASRMFFNCAKLSSIAVGGGHLADALAAIHKPGDDMLYGCALLGLDEGDLEPADTTPQAVPAEPASPAGDAAAGSDAPGEASAPSAASEGHEGTSGQATDMAGASAIEEQRDALRQMRHPTGAALLGGAAAPFATIGGKGAIMPSASTQPSLTAQPASVAAASETDATDGDGADDGLVWNIIGDGDYPCEWSVSDEGIFRLRPVVDGHGEIQSDYDANKANGMWPWQSYSQKVKKAEVIGDVKVIGSLSGFLYYFSKMTEANLSGLDTTEGTTFHCMLAGCQILEKVTFGDNFKTDKGTSFSQMFYYCNKLSQCDVSSFDTSSATSLNYMFYGCRSLPSIDASGFDTRHCKYFNSMFYGCSGASVIDVSSFSTESATSVTEMFYGCSKVSELDTSGFDLRGVTTTSCMFYNCSKVESLTLSNSGSQGLTSTNQMFYGCTSLTELDLSGFCMAGTTNLSEMFYNCKLIKHLDLKAMPKAAYIKGLFSGCTSLESFDTSLLANTTITGMDSAFQNCSSLTSELDMSNIDTSKVTNMSNAFRGCSKVPRIDLGGKFSTESCTNMAYMFYQCSLLQEIDLSHFKTDKVTNFSYMFGSCAGIKEIDLTNINTSKATNVSGMFSGCKSLTEIDTTALDVSNVTGEAYSMSTSGGISGMFNSCTSLTELDLSMWHTEKVVCMSSLFNGCTSLKSVNLGGTFSTVKVVEMASMFYGCTSLRTVDLSNFDTRSLITSNSNAARGVYNMFANTHINTIIMPRYFCTMNVSTPSFPTPEKAYLVENEGLAPEDQYDVTGKWVSSDAVLSGPYTPWQFDNQFGAARGDALSLAGTWTWQVDRHEYNINLDANGGVGTPSMDPVKLGGSFTIPLDGAYRFNHTLIGWNTKANGTGDMFEPGVEYKRDLAASMQTVTLYAQWERESNEATLSDGTLSFTLHGDETALFDGIPAGTRYTVWEETPAGWVCTGSNGESGTIETVTTHIASFTNEYRPDAAQATVHAKVTLDGEAAEGLWFALCDGSGNEVSTASSDAAGMIMFSLEYGTSGIGEHSYAIKQIEGPVPNPDIAIDTEQKSVTVSVSEAGAVLDCSVSYDPADPTFKATTLPSTLVIGRNIAYAGEMNEEGMKGLSFTVRVTLSSPKPGVEDVVSECDIPMIGGTVSIPDIPAGTRYSVEVVRSPEGYGPVEGSDVIEGVLLPGKAESVSPSFAYSARGELAIPILVSLLGGKLVGDDFAFEVCRAFAAADASAGAGAEAMTALGGDGEQAAFGDPLDRGTNDADGSATLVVSASTADKGFTDSNEYSYIVRQDPTPADGAWEGIVSMDSEDRTLTVTWRDNGQGKLVPSLLLDGRALPAQGSVAFENSVRTGTLTISQIAENTTYAHDGMLYATDIAFRDRMGNPIEPAGWHISAAGDAPASSRTGEEANSLRTMSLFKAAVADGSAPSGIMSLTEEESSSLLSAIEESTSAGSRYEGGRVYLRSGDMCSFTLPAGTTYELSQVPRSGFMQPRMGGGAGTIPADDEVRYDMSMAYAASGAYYMQAKVTLDGRALASGEFELIATPASCEGEALRATNDEDGNVVFPLEELGVEDAGKTYEYVIAQADSKVANVTYDRAEFRAVVRIADDAEGKLSADIAYYDESGSEVAEPRFTNQYWDPVALPNTGQTSAPTLASLGLLLVAFFVVETARRERNKGKEARAAR